MKDKGSVLVTGAHGFTGRWVVDALLKRGFRVKAGVRTPITSPGTAGEGTEVITYDPSDGKSLHDLLAGVQTLYHFDGMNDPKAHKEELFRANVDATRCLWSAAVSAGVRTAVYCSSAAVYGLLAHSAGEVSEETTPLALEPFGRSKLLGEKAALEIGQEKGIGTVVIRPVTVLGPGDRSVTARALHRAAFSSFLLARAASDRKFCFVHVQDVAEAAMHLATIDGSNGQIYNVVAERPVSFEEAFQAYLGALHRLGRSRIKARMLGWFSDGFKRLPAISRTLQRYGERLGFSAWRPEYYMTYSAKKLLDTSFRFRWNLIEDVLVSCLDRTSSP